MYFDNKVEHFQVSENFPVVLVDRNLKFVMSFPKSGLLGKNSSSVPEKVLVNLYYSLGHPYFTAISFGTVLHTDLSTLTSTDEIGLTCLNRPVICY